MSVGTELTVVGTATEEEAEALGLSMVNLGEALPESPKTRKDLSRRKTSEMSGTHE